MFRWVLALALLWALMIQALFIWVLIDELRRDLTYGERHMRTILFLVASTASWVTLAVGLVHSVVLAGS